MIEEAFVFSHIAHDDLEEIYQWYATKKYTRFFRHYDLFLNKEQFLQVLNAQGIAIAVKKSESLIGFVVLMIQPLPRICTLSIIIPEHFQKKGLSVRILKEMCRSIFTELGCEMIVVTIVENDERTQFLAEKGGFKKEAIHHRACFFDGVFHDECRYTLTKKDFFTLYPQEA